MGGLGDVDAAVIAAKTAFTGWSGTPAPKRAAILFKYRELLELNFMGLAHIITRENGKTLDDAKGDMRHGIEVVEFSCGISHPGISAISFVGSSHVAKHVYTLGTSCRKWVQAAGGAKNVLLIMPDAEEESKLRAVLGSAYGCAGQRCIAGSILVAIGVKSASQWRD